MRDDVMPTVNINNSNCAVDLRFSSEVFTIGLDLAFRVLIEGAVAA